MDNINQLLKSKNQKFSVMSKDDVRKLKINNDVIVRLKGSSGKKMKGVIIDKKFFYYIIKVNDEFKTIQLNKYDFLKENKTENFMKYLLNSLDNDTIVDNTIVNEDIQLDNISNND